jgi:mRNA-degrading endonuclease YafQ of YafQ-DinJ toxin-antitoxin module
LNFTLEYSSHFKDVYRKLSKKIQRQAEQKEDLFRKNPFDSALKTHKLHGKLKEFYSFSVDYRNRIVFALIRRDKAIFLDIGDHTVYQ